MKKRYACLKDIAYYLPEYIEDNEALVQDMGIEWSAQDIYIKTGIRERHIAAVGECASDLAVKACEKLFLQQPQLREKVDYLIFCSQSPDYFLPATACLLQQRLKLKKNVAALDINQGCSGFIYGLSLAKGLLEAGLASNVLLVQAETYSKYIDRMDKVTRTIFGDGAAASWLTNDAENDSHLNSFVFGTDGNGAANLIVENGAARNLQRQDKRLFMDGPEIFQFALRTVPKTFKAVLDAAGLQKNDIDHFVFHQANQFILEHLQRKLDIEKEKFYIDMEQVGNTVSASIPIALKQGMDKCLLLAGQRVMLIGFGVGYSWGGCILKV